MPPNMYISLPTVHSEWPTITKNNLLYIYIYIYIYIYMYMHMHMHINVFIQSYIKKILLYNANIAIRLYTGKQ